MPLQEVDTYGWDTSFAIRFADANQAITKGWKNVNDAAKNVSQTDEGYSVTAQLEPWQLCEGGDGRNIWMKIPVKSGQFTPASGTATAIAGAVLHVAVNLNYVPNPLKSHNHQLRTDPLGEATSVRDVTGVSLGDIAKSVLKMLFNKWLAANVGEFNHVFHDLDLSDIVDKDDNWAFLTPTAVSYAVTDNGTLDTSVFGVLTMTAGRKPPANHQVSPDAIPAGSNSGFNIAGRLFTEKMLLYGAGLQFQQPESVTKLPEKSPERQKAFEAWVADSFKIANDDMSVTNVKDIIFGTFADDKGELRKLSIQATQFTMSVNYGMLEVEFVNLTYNFSPGVDVHLNYKQHFEVYLADGKENNLTPKKVFALKNVNREMLTSITKARWVQILEIIEGIAFAIVGAVLGGLAGEAIGGLMKGAQATVTAGAEALAEGETVAVITLETQAAKAEIQLTLEGAVTASAEVAGSIGSRMVGFLARIAPKLIGGMVGAGVGAALGAIPSYVALAAEGKFDQLPSFDKFAQKCIGAHNWPNQPGFELKSARLATSFQIGGDLKW